MLTQAVQIISHKKFLSCKALPLWFIMIILSENEYEVVAIVHWIHCGGCLSGGQGAELIEKLKLLLRRHCCGCWYCTVPTRGSRGGKKARRVSPHPSAAFSPSKFSPSSTALSQHLRPSSSTGWQLGLSTLLSSSIRSFPLHLHLCLAGWHSRCDLNEQLMRI